MERYKLTLLPIQNWKANEIKVSENVLAHQCLKEEIFCCISYILYLLQLVASSLVETTASSCSIFTSRKFFKIKRAPSGFDFESVGHLNCEYTRGGGVGGKPRFLLEIRAIFPRKLSTSTQLKTSLASRTPFQLRKRQKLFLQPVVWHTHICMRNVARQIQ